MVKSESKNKQDFINGYTPYISPLGILLTAYEVMP